MKRFAFLALFLILGAKSTGFTTTGAGLIYQGSSFPWQASWSSDWDGSAGSLHVLAKLGNVEKIRCDSFQWATLNEDGSITAQGLGAYLEASRYVYLNVRPGSPVGCTIYVYNPFFPPALYTFPVNVTSGSLTTY